MRAFDVLSQASVGDRCDIDLTVVVPTSNTELFIPSCLNSITNQRGLRLELIVVDYKSVDRSLDVVREFGVSNPSIPLTIVQQNTPGLGDARNIGLDLAVGEYIAFLDSDDFFSPDSYSAMVQYARAHRCDLVFCRAMVFDDATRDIYPFYDDWVWDEIIGSAEALTTTALSEPRLFKFEPNASVRMMRRAFMLAQSIRYPEKKRAEDMVPHYRSLFLAERIGLVSRRGFFYRVGREGKLTSDPSKWIGDLLEATARATGEAHEFEPTPQAGASMVYLCVRALFGYGTQLPYEQRREYYGGASLFISQLPDAWITQALAGPMHPQRLENVRMTVALHALRAQAVDFLIWWSANPRSVLAAAFKFAGQPTLMMSLVRRHWRQALSWRRLRELRGATLHV